MHKTIADKIMIQWNEKGKFVIPDNCEIKPRDDGWITVIFPDRSHVYLNLVNYKSGLAKGEDSIHLIKCNDDCYGTIITQEEA